MENNKKRCRPSPLGIQANDLVMYFNYFFSPELVRPSFEYRRCRINEIVVDMIYNIYPFWRSMHALAVYSVTWDPKSGGYDFMNQ